MEKIVETLKAHPMLAVGAGLILFLLFRSGGSAAPDSTGATLQSQALANDANIAIAGINADVQKSSNLAAMDLFKSMAGFAAQKGMADSENNVALFAHILERDNNAQLIDAQMEYDRQFIAANQKIALAGFANEYAMLDNTNSTNRAIAEISANTALSSTQMTLASNERMFASKIEKDWAIEQYAIDNDRIIAFEHYNTERAAMAYDYSGALLDYKLGRAQQKNDRNMGYLDQANRAFATYMSFGASEL